MHSIFTLNCVVYAFTCRQPNSTVHCPCSSKTPSFLTLVSQKHKVLWIFSFPRAKTFYECLVASFFISCWVIAGVCWYRVIANSLPKNNSLNIRTKPPSSRLVRSDFTLRNEIFFTGWDKQAGIRLGEQVGTSESALKVKRVSWINSTGVQNHKLLWLFFKSILPIIN